MLILYTLTLFLSASLLFIVQPMFTRLVVPLLGGSPAVWNAGQAFFQMALLGGYAYAYATSRWVKPRWQIVLHLTLGLAPLALLMLPIRIPPGWIPPTDSNPLPWLLGLLTLAVGLPFFVLSATTPLLQQWFTRTGHPAAADPYFLYAASNAGSLLALLSYPVLIEPTLRLTDQSWLWAGGYVLLIALVTVCGIMLWRHKAPPSLSVPSSELEVESVAITPLRRIRWVLLALAPVSLMLSIVTYISTDMASIPLLWVIPLSIYLLTFVFVFARKPPIPHIWIVRIAPLAVLALVWIMAARPTGAALALILAQLLAFFFVAMICHGELAQDRPGVAGLTEFYLWISVGGVLGGVFNAVVAPLIFTSVIEYPITLVLVGLLLPKAARQDKPRPVSAKRQKAYARKAFEIPEKQRWMLDIGLPVVLFGVTAALLLLYNMQTQEKAGMVQLIVIFGLPALICFFFRLRPLRFGLGLAAILLAGTLFTYEGGQMLYAERSFFGVNRVFALQGGSRLLMHGNTIHGLQNADPTWRKVPLTYYYPTGPVGQVFETRKDDQTSRKVAVVGLGTGSMACYAQPGGVKLPQESASPAPLHPPILNPKNGGMQGGPSDSTLTFYEIDPGVERIARDPNYFTFIQDCAPNAKVILGDGRLSLASAPDGEYNLIVLDAFSSDAIPIHLLTREALQLYLDKLAPGGLLIFHITSRYFNLNPVLGELAGDAGLAVRVGAEKDIAPADAAQGKLPSIWVVIARASADLGELANDPRWVLTEARPGTRVWTDDFASLLSVLK